METEEINIMEIKHIAIVGDIGEDREELVREIEDFYDEVYFKISKKTQLVVHGDNCDKEIKKARKLDIPTQRYEKFMYDLQTETVYRGISNLVSAAADFERKKLKEQLREKFKEKNYSEKELDKLVEEKEKERCLRALKVETLPITWAKI